MAFYDCVRTLHTIDCCAEVRGKTKIHRILKHGSIVGETEGSRIRTVSETDNLIVVICDYVGRLGNSFFVLT